MITLKQQLNGEKWDNNNNNNNNNEEEEEDGNNNNSYTALYPVKMYELAVQYIINIKIHVTVKKGTSALSAYININMTQSQDET